MLRWMLGIALKDRKRNDDIRHAVGVSWITDKIRESRLRWYGNVQRREDDHCIKRILEAEVYGRRNRGRQRKRWINTISWQDLISLNLTAVDVEDRDDCRRRTRVADPSPEGFTAWKRETQLPVYRTGQACYYIFCVKLCGINPAGCCFKTMR